MLVLPLSAAEQRQLEEAFLELPWAGSTALIRLWNSLKLLRARLTEWGFPAAKSC